MALVKRQSFVYNIAFVAIQPLIMIGSKKHLIALSISTNVQQELPPDIEKETQKRIDNGYHLGTVIGIADEDGVRYYSFGQMSLNDDSKPDKNSFFEIASITKPFTAALLTDLELKNEIDINSSIENYLPIFKQILAKSNNQK